MRCDRSVISHLLGCLFAASSLVASALSPRVCRATTFDIHPAVVDEEEEFERQANSLKPGDELILHGGVYSQNARRAVTVSGTPEAPVIIRAADGERPLLTRPRDNIDTYNNIEFVDCSHLVVRGIRFRGGSSGVRFIRGHDITFEDCEIFETGNNALTMNSGNCDRFIIRRNHLHHTGLSRSRPTEGEGMYIGRHDGSCVATNTLVEGNYIHHLRGTSEGGNDGIEIKFGSYNNTVRDNVVHDTNIGRQYPGIFVYGGGPGVNIVEGNAIWNAGAGIQVVSDAIVRNNIVFRCAATGITAAPHAAVREMRRVTIVNNTFVNHPRGVVIRWSASCDMVFANNAVYCPENTALDVSGVTTATMSANYVEGQLIGMSIDNARLFDGGAVSEALVGSEQKQFWPGPGSILIGRADTDFAPESDFHHAARKASCDVGAYESDVYSERLYWAIKPDFKAVTHR